MTFFFLESIFHSDIFARFFLTDKFDFYLHSFHQKNQQKQRSYYESNEVWRYKRW